MRRLYRPIVFAVVAVLMAGCTAVGRKIDGGDVGKPDKGDAMMASRTLSVSIERPTSTVYEFLSNPGNMPKWAKGLGTSIRKQGAGWTVETRQGPVNLRFVEKNNFGVLDHYVTTASGIEVYVPMRVLSNGLGSEVIFTLFRLPGMSDEKYAEDMKMVEQDLQTLKVLLER